MESFDENEEIQTNDSQAKRKKTFGSAVKDFGKNIKNVFKGGKKQIFLFKAKLIMYAILIGIAVLVFIALIVEANAEETSNVATRTVVQTFAQSTTESAELFNTTGSLLFATDEDLNKISTEFFKEFETSNESYYDAFKTEYSGKAGSTIANKITHITTNYESQETEELAQITNNVSKISGQASLEDAKTIFDHILRTEKYNFNNIIWRSYVKSGSGVTQANMSFQVDSNSKLKYPSSDTANQDNATQDLKFFITKARPYLQSWYIPFDIITGTQDAQSGEGINTKLAYEILASTYHEIVMDRYKVETLTRTTDYKIYDKTTDVTTVTRNCAQYTLPVEEEETEPPKENNSGTITKPLPSKPPIKNPNVQVELMSYTKYNVDEQLSFTPIDIIKSESTTSNSKKETTVVTYCTDTVTTSTSTEKDIRESVSVSKDSENTKYRWDYVVTMAKMFDNVISNTYKFKPFTASSTASYESYIAKSGDYKNMTAEQYSEKEKELANADSFSHTEEDYYESGEPSINDANKTWNSSNVVSTIPKGVTKVKNSETSQVVSTTTKIIKEGKTYQDIYVWNDQLNFEGTKSGIYNVDSVKDVTGDDLTSEDNKYYQNLYASQEINLIDIMNSNKDIYSNYISTYDMSNQTENIGIRKSALDISYSVLKKDLSKLLEDYPLLGIRYGESLGIKNNAFSILSGLSFSNVQNIAAGRMENYNVAYTIAPEDLDNAILSVGTKYGQSYGYQGHTGIDISYYYSAADKTLCSDYSDSMCPYIKGPSIYTVMDGVIKEVGYSAYNKYYNVGDYIGVSSDGNLKISDTSGWGSYVKIENVDGSYVIYSHLFPDREFFKSMSEAIGQPVSAGTFIGNMGNTGNSSGLHLHIEFAESFNTLGGRTSNSSLTYVYLMKIIDAMGINPKKG